MRGLRPVPISTPGDSRRMPLTLRRPKRQLGNFLSIERLRLLGGRRTNQRGNPLDTNCLCNRADLKREGLAYRLSRGQSHVPALELFEALGLNPQRVEAYAEKIEAKFSAGIADLGGRSRRCPRALALRRRMGSRRRSNPRRSHRNLQWSPGHRRHQVPSRKPRKQTG